MDESMVGNAEFDIHCPDYFQIIESNEVTSDPEIWNGNTQRSGKKTRRKNGAIRIIYQKTQFKDN